MGILDDLGLTPEDLRAAIRDGGAGDASPLVPVAPENTPEGRAAIRRDRAAKQGRAARDAVALGRASPGTPGDVDLPDAAVEGVLGEGAVATALDVREKVERVIEQAAAEGAAWASGPMAEQLREHTETRLYEAAALDAKVTPASRSRPTNTALRDFLTESGDIINDSWRGR